MVMDQGRLAPTPSLQEGGGGGVPELAVMVPGEVVRVEVGMPPVCMVVVFTLITVRVLGAVTVFRVVSTLTMNGPRVTA